MGKTKKQLTTEERLNKVLSKGPAPTGPLITSPRIFAPFLLVTRYYLEQQQFSQAAREFVASMAFQFRNEALIRFGHDTIETIQLARLLRNKVVLANTGTPDVVTYLAKSGRPLNVTQVSAATHIRGVWESFGKGLLINGRSMESSGRSGVARQPIDNISDEQWHEYKSIYVPWYEITSKIIIWRRPEGPAINLAGVVFKLLIEDIYPEILDKTFALGVSHACVRLLGRALDYYWAPLKIPKAVKAILYPPSNRSKTP